MTIAISILGLAALILVHELGHFVVSLALGMRPRRFYIGFPPAVWKRTVNGIEYGIGAIPLGGFVKIPGMHRPAASDVDVALGRALAETPGLTEFATRLRGALADGDHDAAAREVVAIRHYLAGRQLSEPVAHATARGLDDLEDALGPRAYWRAATWRRVAAIAAGPLANVLLALALFTGLYLTSDVSPTTAVAQVRAGSPAATMGLRAGDHILSIDGFTVTPADIPKRIAASEGRPLILVVKRSGEPFTLPAATARTIDGALRLGFGLQAESLALPDAVVAGTRLTGLITGEIVTSIGRLARGEGRDQIASPIGIVKGSSDAAKEGAGSFLFVLALISLSIALLNLLPLLPLDGGHIVFAVAEGLRGRAVPRVVYERVSIVGIALVLLLFFIGVTNDVGTLS